MASSRRRFILSTAQSVGIFALGGFLWSEYTTKAVSSPLILRPPGALSEELFLSTCIKCGLCVQACPYKTLSLATLKDDKAVGTPFFEPRQIPCYMCTDIPCVPVCPTEALSTKKLLTNDKLDINKSRMGTAMVDANSCIAFWGIQCDACYRACPLLGEAITLEYRRNERTGKHAFLIPLVDSQKCTGCGLCEHACVTKKAAIFVRPINIAQGEVGSHYIKGWDENDEQRLHESKQIKTKVKHQTLQNYLNTDEVLYDK